MDNGGGGRQFIEKKLLGVNDHQDNLEHYVIGYIFNEIILGL